MWVTQFPGPAPTAIQPKWSRAAPSGASEESPAERGQISGLIPSPWQAEGGFELGFPTALGDCSNCWAESYKGTRPHQPFYGFRPLLLSECPKLKKKKHFQSGQTEMISVQVMWNFLTFYFAKNLE